MGCLASEGGVGAVMVVEVQPAIKGAVACGFAAVGTDVGTLVEEGAVEEFDYAVGGGPVGACEGVLDVAERGVELPAAVAAAVIGQDAFDRDGVRREPPVGSAPERSEEHTSELQ